MNPASLLERILSEPGLIATSCFFLLAAIFIWKIPDILRSRSEAESRRTQSLRDELKKTQEQVKSLSDKNLLLQEFIVKSGFFADMRENNRNKLDKAMKRLDEVVLELKTFDRKHPDMSEADRNLAKARLETERNRLFKECKETYIERSTLLREAEAQLHREGREIRG
jgi:hypothetical protein